MNLLQSTDVAGKTVFYRPDYNVPLQDGEIQDDFRILSTFDTLDYLIKQGCKIVIGCHLGRPEGKAVPELELRPVAEVLADQYPKQVVRLAHEVEGMEIESAVQQMEAGDILLLPNLRFYPEEEAHGKKFAQKLAALADVYVNDAFACDHRDHASIVGVPSLIPGCAGFLLQQEIEGLNVLIEEPERPFIAIMGGAKVSDKIEVIRNIAKKADFILIGGAMANTFLLADGQDISNSVAEKDKVELAKKLKEELGDKLVFPVDYVKDVAEDDSFKYLDIGEESVKLFEQHLKDAKTVFWNGSLGYAEQEEFAKATNAIAHAMAKMKHATTVIAGGDTVETVTRLDLYDKISFVSTGGGAALDFLAGKDLPGIAVLEEKPAK